MSGRPMEVSIREAKKEDCPRLLELVRELALYERAPDEVTISLEHFTESGFGDQPVWKAIVAEDADGIQGFALYYLRFSTWKGKAMYLEDILVTEKKRGQGIGHLLFEKLVEEARKQGLKRIVWQVLNWNEPAIAFYKKYNAAFDGDWINCSISV